MTKLNHISSACLLLLTVALLGWGCKEKSILMESARVALVENNVDLRSMQVYNDKAIILRRQANSSEVSQTGGKLIMVDGQQVLEVVIRANTPGVITGSQNGKFLVRFETGSGKILQFYKNSKGAFQIDADRWIGQKGALKYANLDFTLESESNNVILMYVQKKKYRSSTNQRTVKGLKVPKGGR
jgi:hypothetical protein